MLAVLGLSVNANPSADQTIIPTEGLPLNKPEHVPTPSRLITHQQGFHIKLFCSVRVLNPSAGQ